MPRVSCQFSLPENLTFRLNKVRPKHSAHRGDCPMLRSAYLFQNASTAFIRLRFSVVM